MTPRCANYRDVIDALDTKHPHPAHVEAVQHMCSGCPLQPRCHATHDGDRWLTHVQRGVRDPKPPPQGWVQRAATRAQALEAYIADGMTRAEAASRLGIAVGTLENWCYRWQATHLWHALKAAS